MFAGHLAVAFAAKRAEPDLPLGWSVAAVSFVDLLWPIFLLTGIERVAIVPGATAFGALAFEHYPWTHSLAMSLAWGLALAGLARLRGQSARAARWVAALVVSHWLLDAVTHIPDLPLWPGGGPLVGLGLWNSVPGTILVEGGLWVAGLAVWLSIRRPRGVAGWLAFASFVLVATAIWISGPFAPPPPNAQGVAFGALMAWLTIPWAAWIERTSAPRAPRPGSRRGAPAS